MDRRSWAFNAGGADRIAGTDPNQPHWRLDTRDDVMALKADLGWRMVAVVGSFGIVITLVNAFIRSFCGRPAVGFLV